MSSGSPSIGDKVVVISNSLCRYEGYFHSVDETTATFTLSKVRSFGTEDRNAPHRYAASARLYQSIEFTAADVKEFVLVESSGLTDPAVVSAREQRDDEDNDHEFTSSSIHSQRVMEASSDTNHGHHILTQKSRPRSFGSKPASVSEGGLRYGGLPSSYHGNNFGLQSGGLSVFRNGGRPHYSRNDWRTINPRSEGSFPQKHPGMQQPFTDDFNFEQGIEEFTRLKLDTSCGDSSSEEFHSDNETAAKDAKEKEDVTAVENHVYDKKKSFFDNLTRSAGFDPRRQRNRFRTGGPHGAGLQVSRPYNPNVETFGEETVKQLYEIRKYAPDQRSLVRSVGFNSWHQTSGGFHNSRSGVFVPRNIVGSRRQWFDGTAFI
ncbi:hypothetical protein BIW11_11959 [Tropilaelaps mercedesae]|uniref:FFD box profile domain-containing protein n=1 Tax=Tropilaelaps mercedesae TaxID=418985 RepID=A0A1V9X8Q1_9ACAR|nr:hypothetical protein BIW11_11959 [Tropilaelaps mercedesae]